LINDLTSDVTGPVSFIFAQLAVSVVISALLLLYDWPAAYSALIGGSIATLANAWFAAKVFSNRRINEPVLLLRAFYTGELYKILLTGALFVMAFVLVRPINAVTLLLTYFVVHIASAFWGFARSTQSADTANRNIEEKD